jgi:Cof subfamily protein (haloacid dehalogenase superfamily)
VDLDGTLVHSDDTIDSRDLAAMRMAIERGIVVTIATGRLSRGALSIAREVGVDVPLICADGAALVCAHTGECLEEDAIDVPRVKSLLAVLESSSLAPYLFVYDGAHGETEGSDFAGYAAAWATHVTLHRRLVDADTLFGRTGILVAMGLGDRAQAESARAALLTAHGAALEVTAFCLSGADWAVRAQRRGLSKGACLAHLCARLGIERTRVAAVGDWYNDLPMFAWAGRSFAMGHAPEMVRAAATDVLSATAKTRGGVAEALGRWLGWTERAAGPSLHGLP